MNQNKWSTKRQIRVALISVLAVLTLRATLFLYPTPSGPGFFFLTALLYGFAWMVYAATPYRIRRMEPWVFVPGGLLALGFYLEQKAALAG